jgi:seryl-tRNA synthetase
MKMLQESAQQAITTQAKKRDAKEAKLKEALSQLADELEAATSANALLEDKLKSLALTSQETSNQLEVENSGLKDKLQELSDQLAARK